ncbi:hypothetical protein HDU79_009993 [Rhizoclosmatium sp. JEL0117]|nr:hypothetical protein HDU79_009993 [Rhizoclosmatium sp. JEL0117]
MDHHPFPFKNQSSITVALIGPYSLFSGLTYDGFEVVGGMDQLNITALGDLNQWGDPSWFYWNQVALEIAINDVNRDPTVLSNTTIRIKRFNNGNGKYEGSEGSLGRAMALAYDIANNHQDVVAVFGDFYGRTMISDGEVYSYYKIPQCTGSTTLLKLASRTNYPYYFQLFPATGWVESIGITLKTWHVTRVGLVCSGGTANELCDQIVQVLSIKFDIQFLVRVSVDDPKPLGYIAQKLGQADARYIILIASPSDTAQIYFGLATKYNLVGSKYVWFTANQPIFGKNATAQWGSDYFKFARGMMFPMGYNSMNSYMDQLANEYVKEVQEFQAPWGISYYLYYVDGLDATFNLVPFAATDINVTTFSYLNNSKPVFYDGGSTPPPDSPQFTYATITSSSSTGTTLIFFAASGIALNFVFIGFLLFFWNIKSFHLGSKILTIIIIIGSLPSYIANMLYLNQVTVLGCLMRQWLQTCSFAVIYGTLLAKNTRLLVVYTSKDKLTTAATKEFRYICLAAGLIVVEIVLLVTWTVYSNWIVIDIMIPRDLVQQVCVNTASSKIIPIEAVLWAYNGVIILGLYFMSYYTRRVPPIHSDSNKLLISVSPSDHDSQHEELIEAVLIYLNTTSPILMDMSPRIISMANTWALKGNAKPHTKTSKLAHSTSFAQSHSQTGSIKNRNVMQTSDMYPVFYLQTGFGLMECWRKGIAFILTQHEKTFLNIISGLEEQVSHPAAFLVTAPSLVWNEKKVKFMLIDDGSQGMQERFVWKGVGGRGVLIDFPVVGKGKEFSERFSKMTGRNIVGTKTAL